MTDEYYEGVARVEGGGETVFYADKRDAPWIEQYRWWCNKFGYIYRRSSEKVDGRWRSVNVFLHREVAGLEKGDTHEADHLNFDRLDCRRENLEIKTRTENRMRQRRWEDGHVNEGPPRIVQGFN